MWLDSIKTCRCLTRYNKKWWYKMFLESRFGSRSNMINNANSWHYLRALAYYRKSKYRAGCWRKPGGTLWCCACVVEPQQKKKSSEVRVNKRCFPFELRSSRGVFEPSHLVEVYLRRGLGIGVFSNSEKQKTKNLRSLVEIRASRVGSSTQGTVP